MPWQGKGNRLLEIKGLTCGYDKRFHLNGIDLSIEEGGFFGIITDDHKVYDPGNLPSQFRIDGQKIAFTGRVCENRTSFHMCGTIIELTWIKKL